MYKKLRVSGILLMTALIILNLTGCSPGKKNQNEEPVTQPETKQVIIETEPEPTATPIPTATPEPTQPPTEKEVTVRDLQVAVPATDRSGNIQYTIKMDDGTEFNGSGNFESSDSAFYALVDEGELYGDEISTLYRMTGTEWVEEDSVYDNIWESIYMEDCTKMTDIISDGTEYYHLSATQDSPFNSIASIGCLHGLTDVINGDPSFDIYISKDTENIMRMDMSFQFRGTLNGGSQKGNMTVTFIPTGTSGVSMDKPEAPEEDDYVPGEISAVSNKYQNKTFDIQVLGGDIFTYDPEKTAELDESYKANNSGYKEEAYGSSVGVIVNISSIKAEENTKENVMAKYLNDCVASNIMNMGTITVGSTEYVTSTADINGTKTKTYCTLSDDRALIVTIYCNESNTIAAFEDNIYSVTENPFWQEESWVLEGKYEVSTPKGYSIVKEESNNLYTCMRSTSDSVDIFALENSTIDAESSKEMQSIGSEIKELISQEDIETGTNGTMRYLILHSTDSGLEYYTYIGLLQKNTAVIKLYSVSASSDKDYKYIFLKFADKLKDVSETSASAEESGEANSGEISTETEPQS